MDRLVSFLAILLVSAFFLPFGAAEPEKKDRKAEIEKLIADLDSPIFKVREGAVARLIAIGEDALPALRKALDEQPALDMRTRLGNIEAKMAGAIRERAIGAMGDGTKDIAIDQFIDLMVTCKGFASDRTWESAEKMAQAIVDRSSDIADRKYALPCSDFLKLEVADPDRNANQRKRLRVEGMKEGVATEGSVVISSGTVEGLSRTRNCVFFVNGDIKGWNRTYNCLIFCTGNVENLHRTSNCIIIATGAFRACSSTTSSFLQVKATEKLTGSARNTYLNLTKIEAIDEPRDDAFPENAKGPLQLFKFFDPASTGIEVADKDGSPRIEKVIEGKPVAIAGARAGDRITRIDGHKAATTEDVKRLLRRKFAGDRARITVARDKEEVTLDVPF